MHVFWTSDVAVRTFPIMRRLYMSWCSPRPDNDAESERDFSAAMTRLLSPLRRGRMKTDTVARKLFLSLNTTWWMPNPELRDDVYWLALLRGANMNKWGERAPPSDSEESSDSDA